MQLNSIILCAGKGTRMQSDSPKVIQKILGYEMINLVLKSLTGAGVENNHLVVGYKKDDVLKSIDEKFQFDHSKQEEQLGTGHAVMMAKESFIDKEGITIVTCGDTPLISVETFKRLIKNHQGGQNDLTILTARIENPTGYGRIVRNDVGQIEAIIEEKDATKEQKRINEINSGIYCFNTKKLFKYIEHVDNNNAQEEYYITDLVKIMKQENQRVSTYITPISEEISGVNNLLELEKANKALQMRINRNLLESGVKIMDLNSVFIGPNVEIEKGTIIYPHNVIEGNTKIGKNNKILPNNMIYSSSIGEGSEIGPSSHLREASNIGNNCKVGNFVEVKNSTIKDKTKIGHLTYIGDAIIGENVNVGCGVITANYDGVNKFKTIIEDDSFIGSNVNLVAPVSIGKGSFIAAGTTVNNDIEEEKFVIGRTKEVIKEKRG